MRSPGSPLEQKGWLFHSHGAGTSAVPSDTPGSATDSPDTELNPSPPPFVNVQVYPRVRIVTDPQSCSVIIAIQSAAATEQVVSRTKTRSLPELQSQLAL